MYNGLRLWLIWEQELPLAVWRKPLVKWVLGHPQSAEGHKALAVPEFAYNLCEHHKLWMRSPLDIAVPVYCWSQDEGEEKGKENIVSWRYHQPPLEIPLALLIYRSVPLGNLSNLDYVPQPAPAAAAVANASALEYIASAYGVERVQLLLAAIPEHEREETRIPATLGLSLEEFESGWRDFLQEQYDIMS